MASATPAALRSVKPPGSVRGMKKLDKEALSITAQVPGFRVPAKSMHQVCRRQINCCTWIYLEKFFHLCLMQLQVSDAHQGEQKRRHIPSSADPLISVSLLSGAFKMEEAAVEGAQSKTCGGTECRWSRCEDSQTAASRPRRQSVPRVTRRRGSAVPAECWSGLDIFSVSIWQLFTSTCCSVVRKCVIKHWQTFCVAWDMYERAFLPSSVGKVFVKFGSSFNKQPLVSQDVISLFCLLQKLWNQSGLWQLEIRWDSRRYSSRGKWWNRRIQSDRNHSASQFESRLAWLQTHHRYAAFKKAEETVYAKFTCDKITWQAERFVFKMSGWPSLSESPPPRHKFCFVRINRFDKHDWRFLGDTCDNDEREFSFAGEVLLDKVPTARTVVNKLGTIANVYRTFDMELLAGEDNTLVTTSEMNCSYTFDFAKVYWNPKLGKWRKMTWWRK